MGRVLAADGALRLADRRRRGRVDDAPHAGLRGGRDDQARALDVQALQLARVGQAEPVQAGQVVDDLAPRHRALERGRVEDVAAHRLRARARERAGRLDRPGERPHLAPPLDQPRQHGAAHEAAPAGDEDRAIAHAGGRLGGHEAPHGIGALERERPGGEILGGGALEPPDPLLDDRRAPGGDAQLVDPEAHEERHRRRVGRRLAAHGHPRPAVAPRPGHARDQAQHGRVDRVGKVGDAGVAALGGHRVLHEVVGPDRQEVDLRGQRLGHQRRGRHLDHRPDLDRRRLLALGRERLAGLVQQALRRAQLVDLAHHREHDAHRPAPRRAQRRPQLGEQRVGPGAATGAGRGRRGTGWPRPAAPGSAAACRLRRRGCAAPGAGRRAPRRPRRRPAPARPRRERRRGRGTGTRCAGAPRRRLPRRRPRPGRRARRRSPPPRRGGRRGSPPARARVPGRGRRARRRRVPGRGARRPPPRRAPPPPGPRRRRRAAACRPRRRGWPGRGPPRRGCRASAR